MRQTLSGGLGDRRSKPMRLGILHIQTHIATFYLISIFSTILPNDGGPG
jgi:hypothetical protein